MITQEYLKQILHYNAETGVFSWNKQLTNNIKKGQIAGSLRKDGRIQIRTEGKIHLAHRLAWLYVYGEFPAHVIDHIDGDPSNNRLSNLRECSQSENLKNTRIHSDNTSGYKGVTWAAHTQKWKAYCSKNGKRTNLGYFQTAKEASDAYNRFAALSHGEFYKDTTKKETNEQTAV
jgi:hypothetical protein